MAAKAQRLSGDQIRTGGCNGVVAAKTTSIFGAAREEDNDTIVSNSSRQEFLILSMLLQN